MKYWGYIVFIGSVVSNIAYGLCSISATHLNFGDYNTLSPSPLTSRATLNFKNCKGSLMTVSILSDQNNNAYYKQLRNSENSNEYLRYNLYKDMNHTLVWGEGFQQAWSAVIPDDDFTQVIYGVIPARQDVAVGNYQGHLVLSVGSN